jgi:hypothetical protein
MTMNASHDKRKLLIPQMQLYFEQRAAHHAGRELESACLTVYKD